MKSVIIDKSNDKIVSYYEGSPNQSSYGGPWSQPELFAHVEVPSDMDINCIEAEMVDGEYELSENADKLQDRRDKKLDELRAMRDERMKVADVLVNELVLGIRSDTAAVASFRQALLDITEDYKKVDGHAKALVDSKDWNNDVTWPDEP